MCVRTGGTVLSSVVVNEVRVLWGTLTGSRDSVELKRETGWNEGGNGLYVTRLT